MDNQDKNYYNVPIYIEKAIKKLNKQRQTTIELVSQIRDYMESHNIPKETPLELLKYFPPEDVDPNQIQMDFNSLN